MRGDQREAGMDRLADRGERGGAQPDAEDEGDAAKAAEPAVAHDGELGVAPVAAAKPVGGVGEAILMQSAGQREAGGNREECGHGIAASGQLGGQKRQRAKPTDPGPDQRKRPARGGDRAIRRHASADRQPGQQLGGDGEFVERPLACIHARDHKRFC